MTGASEFGAVLARLAQTIAARKTASTENSYTASLLAGGPAKCAKKFGEEAIELALAGVHESEARVAAEAADVLYHLLVLLAARGVSTDAVAGALLAREASSGHVEKAARDPK